MKSIRAAVLLGLLIVSSTVSAEDVGTSKRVALLVGVNRYDKPIFSQLNYSERDVLDLAAELKSLGFDVTVLKGSGQDDERATRANIRTALRQLVAPLGDEDVMLVMFSGHGQQIDTERSDGTLHNDAFYCPVDAVSNDPETMISLSYVIDEILAPNVGRKLLLVDACRDAPKDPSRGSRGIEGKVIALPEDTAILFSCRKGQQSWEDDELQHGLFTYCVLDALRGDGTQDAEISWTDVVAHVNRQMASSAMRQRMGKPQEPIPAGGVPYTVLGKLAPVAVIPECERPGEVREFGGELKIKMCWCPAGTFTMGTPESDSEHKADEGPVEVTFVNGFWVSQTEVTQNLWWQVMENEPWRDHFQNSVHGPRFPAAAITFGSAFTFCDRLTKREWAAGRLPENMSYTLLTEAEWEYACRAGGPPDVHLDALDDYAWFGESKGEIHPVATKEPNAWGIYDMQGNVCEWCLDIYKADYLGGTDPLQLEVEEGREPDLVYRGGYYGSERKDCRAAARRAIIGRVAVPTFGVRLGIANRVFSE